MASPSSGFYLISNLPESCGPKFPFWTRPAGSALLILLLKERWVKRPAGEEQEGEGVFKQLVFPQFWTGFQQNMVTKPKVSLKEYVGFWTHDAVEGIMQSLN